MIDFIKKVVVAANRMDDSAAEYAKRCVSFPHKSYCELAYVEAFNVPLDRKIASAMIKMVEKSKLAIKPTPLRRIKREQEAGLLATPTIELK